MYALENCIVDPPGLGDRVTSVNIIILPRIMRQNQIDMRGCLLSLPSIFKICNADDRF